MICALGHTTSGHRRDFVGRLLGAEQGAGVEAEADLAVVGGARRRPDDFQIERGQELQGVRRDEIEVVRHDRFQHLRRHLVEGGEVREALFFRDPLDGVLAVLLRVGGRRRGEREGEDERLGEHGGAGDRCLRASNASDSWAATCYHVHSTLHRSSRAACWMQRPGSDGMNDWRAPRYTFCSYARAESGSCGRELAACKTLGMQAQSVDNAAPSCTHVTYGRQLPTRRVSTSRSDTWDARGFSRPHK